MSKSSPILTDFTAGELSRKYASRVDDPIYSKGARRMENMRPLAQGGFRSTGGSWFEMGLTSGVSYRLIPFMVSESVRFLIVLSPGNLIINKVNDDGSLDLNTTIAAGTTYSPAQLGEVKFCQNANEMYFTHRNHTPRVLTYTGTGLEYSDMEFTTNTGEDIPFQKSTDYPANCTFFSGRLFFSNTISKPQGIWASIPYESGNFTKFELVETTVTQIKDKSEWEDPEEPETEEVSTTKTVIGDGNSFNFEIASEQNDTIVWMAPAEDLLIGTLSSEWTCPKEITANDLSADLISRIGTANIQAKLVGGYIILIQRGGRKVWQYDGKNSTDLTFNNDQMAESPIIGFDAQKIHDQIIFFVREDGQIAVLMYSPAHDIQGWYRLKDDNFSYLSVAVVPTEKADHVYVIIRDTDGAQRIERLDEDCFTRASERVVIAGGVGAVTNLAGDIQVWKSGSFEQVSAVNGSFNTTLPDGEYYVGYGFSSILETMSVEVQSEIGPGQFKEKSASNIYIQVNKGGEFGVGYSSDPASLKTVNGTGLVTSDFHGGYEQDLSIMVLQEKAYPLEITVLMPEIEMETI